MPGVTNTSTALSRDRLVATFQSYGRPRESWLVGAEFERHMLRSDGSPVPYFGEHGIRWLLEQLEARGWDAEHEGEHPIAVHRGTEWITLEPGSQFELSGSPFRSVQEVFDEAAALAREVDALCAAAGADVHQVALGFTPFARIDDIPWVPKGRYAIMKEYLRRTGSLAHHMMKGTCAVQASYDFADEADAAAKVRLATHLAPLTTALFANSPLSEGRPNGYMSWRGHVWTAVDPRRTGLPDAAENFSFERWVDYLLQVPMMFQRDAEGRWIHAHGRTFADWLASDAPPAWKDWDLHMTSVFPEVRVKRTIEVRGADCVPLPLAMSFVALFKGLFYCERALDEATEFGRELASYGTKEERWEIACREGLQGVIGGRRLAAWGERLLDLADAALDRCAPEDRPWLGPLRRQVESGESPARALLRAWQAEPTVETLLRCSPILGTSS